MGFSINGTGTGFTVSFVNKRPATPKKDFRRVVENYKLIPLKNIFVLEYEIHGEYGELGTSHAMLINIPERPTHFYISQFLKYRRVELGIVNEYERKLNKNELPVIKEQVLKYIRQNVPEMAEYIATVKE